MQAPSQTSCTWQCGVSCHAQTQTLGFPHSTKPCMPCVVQTRIRLSVNSFAQSLHQYHHHDHCHHRGSQIRLQIERSLCTITQSESTRRMHVSVITHHDTYYLKSTMVTSLLGLTLYLDRTVTQRKPQRKAKPQVTSPASVTIPQRINVLTCDEK